MKRKKASCIWRRLFQILKEAGLLWSPYNCHGNLRFLHFFTDFFTFLGAKTFIFSRALGVQRWWYIIIYSPICPKITEVLVTAHLSKDSFFGNHPKDCGSYIDLLLTSMVLQIPNFVSKLQANKPDRMYKNHKKRGSLCYQGYQASMFGLPWQKVT